MRAVVQRGYGSPDVLAVEEIEPPAIGAGEVLVRVHAAGIDRGTWHIMTGLPRLLRLGFGLRAPKQPVPGLDLSGVVVAVGAEVSGFTPGDEVFGIGRGSFAELCAAPADKLVVKPSSLTFEQAAAVPVSGLTALQGLCDVGQLRAGQHVLIIGASGGVGTFAVQIARSIGAEVTAVCRTSKVDLVRSLGADHVIDYTSAALGGEGPYDLIVDFGGKRSLSNLRRMLTRTGTLVIGGGGHDAGRWFGGVDRQLRAVIVSPFVSQRLTMLVSKERAADLERLVGFIDAGDLSPVIEQTYTLDEVPDAMRHLDGGHARGKLVVTVIPSECESAIARSADA